MTPMDEDIFRLLREDEREKRKARGNPATRGKKRPRVIRMPGDLIDKRSDPRYKAGRVTTTLLPGFRRCEECSAVYRVIRPRQRYCSDRCRWRAKARVRDKRRRARGLCPQCGGPMPDPPPASLRKPGARITYCEKCRAKFRAYYMAHQKPYQLARKKGS